MKCEFTESRKSANQLCRCAIADTLAACARPPVQSQLRFSMVENRSRRSPRPHMCASIGVSGIARRANRLRRCAIARRHAPSLCAASATVASPFIDGRKSVASRAHATMRATTEGAEILRSDNSLPRRAIALGHSLRPCAGSRKHRRPRFAMVENRSRRAPTPICVQNPRGPKSLGPVNACAVAPSLSDTSPDHAPARESTAGPVYRWSKIGRVARPRQYACKTRGGRNPEVR